VSAELPIRVRVMPLWEDVPFELAPETPVADIKRQALARTHSGADPGAFLVKFRGGEVRDERRTLAELGVPPKGALIVMRRGRTPVR
jgi:hypothetical protein